VDSVNKICCFASFAPDVKIVRPKNDANYLKINFLGCELVNNGA
jgi:hypothetical protein